MLLALLTRLGLGRRKLERGETEAREDIWQAPAIRDIREIYQTFLRKATRHGYEREQNETPYEFRQRLGQQKSLLEPELQVITEAYALARYGGYIPPQHEIVRIQTAWNELERKWPEEAQSPD
ncbi:MAG TPA: DUF4129 domain-containing protein [Ktedonobacteraceae bacterium]